MAKIDLYVEEEIGLWTLGQFEADDVGCVFSRDQRIRDAAVARGMRCAGEDPNGLEFETASVMLSVHCLWIFKERLLSRYTRAYNLHPGFLPWGRGASPAFWALWKEEPAGATLHLVVRAVDEGPIVDRQGVAYDGATTVSELYREIGLAEQAMLLKHRAMILAGDMPATRLQGEDGSHYSHRDFVSLIRDVRQNWRTMSGAELVRLLRCTRNLPIDVEGRIFNLTAAGLTRPDD